MEKFNRDKDKQPRQPYEKPGLKTIELAADEVLAIGCKTQSSGKASLGISCTLPVPCYQPGS